MIDACAIREIITIYQKHGWVLRRVLLSAGLKKALGKGKDALFGDVPVADSNIDAAWFSRPPKSGRVSWEIRYLGDMPFALLENIDENAPEFENVLGSVESRLRDWIVSKETA